MADHVNDAALLERFVAGREEAAFAALMHRHGPVVRAACRRVLRSEHDAEDVVQATFLVLALKAAEVHWRESVGGWLCAVARRLSLDARAGVYRRSRRETPMAAFSEEHHPLSDPLADVDRVELRGLLDDELNRLPEKYRAPVVLCDLEGLSHSEAARRLGMPSGSISRRLGRARRLLRGRLASRNLPMAVVALCGVLAGFWAAGRGPLARPAAVVAPRAMAPFQGPDLDLERFLTKIGASAPAGFVPSNAETVARQAETIAEQVTSAAPGHDRPAWRSYADELRRSSLDLARASRDGDGMAFVSAARRANASCVSCHLAFRQ